MMPTPNRALGATAHSTQTTDAASFDLCKIAKAIARLDSVPRELPSIFGPSMRGIVPAIFGHHGTTPLSPTLRLTLGDSGPVGFSFGNEVVLDYSSPENGAALYQASNLNLALGLREQPAEELLARHFAAAELPEELAIELARKGLEITQLPLRLATKVAHGIVSECLANAIPAEKQGALHLLRAFPPTIRFNLIEHLLTSPCASMNRDLLLACPLLALLPAALPGFAGRKPREIMRGLGLPTEASKLLPRALSPFRRWLLHDGRDLAQGDIGWLTPELLSALPESSYLQYRTIRLAFTMLIDGMEDHDVAERITWVARNATDLFAKGAAPLDDWLRASRELLDRVAIRPWSRDISAQKALEAAVATVHAHKLLGDNGTPDPFRLPSWAIQRPLPQSRWELRPIGNELDLVAAGRRSANCAALLAGPCRYGAKVIVELTRPITSNSKLPTVGGHEVGAMAEIVRFAGRWQIAQCKGFANGKPVATAHAALVRFVADLNGEAA